MTVCACFTYYLPAQAEYGANLTREIYSHRSDLPNCTNIAVGDTRCACAGGFL